MLFLIYGQAHICCNVSLGSSKLPCPNIPKPLGTGQLPAALEQKQGMGLCLTVSRRVPGPGLSNRVTKSCLQLPSLQTGKGLFYSNSKSKNTTPPSESHAKEAIKCMLCPTCQPCLSPPLAKVQFPADNTCACLTCQPQAPFCGEARARGNQQQTTTEPSQLLAARSRAHAVPAGQGGEQEERGDIPARAAIAQPTGSAGLTEETAAGRGLPAHYKSHRTPRRLHFHRLPPTARHLQCLIRAILKPL